MATYFGIDFGTTNCAVHAITAIGDGIDALIDCSYEYDESDRLAKTYPGRLEGGGFHRLSVPGGRTDYGRKRLAQTFSIV